MLDVSVSLESRCRPAVHQVCLTCSTRTAQSGITTDESKGSLDLPRSDISTRPLQPFGQWQGQNQQKKAPSLDGLPPVVAITFTSELIVHGRSLVTFWPMHGTWVLYTFRSNNVATAAEPSIENTRPCEKTDVKFRFHLSQLCPREASPKTAFACTTLRTSRCDALYHVMSTVFADYIFSRCLLVHLFSSCMGVPVEYGLRTAYE